MHGNKLEAILGMEVHGDHNLPVLCAIELPGNREVRSGELGSRFASCSKMAVAMISRLDDEVYSTGSVGGRNSVPLGLDRSDQMPAPLR